MTSKELVQQWLAIAEGDLEMAQLANKHGKWLYVAFHCQQSIEKSLKGLIILLTQQQPPYIHDLPRLWAHIKQIDSSIPGQSNTLNDLNTYYIEARYPSYKQKIAAQLSKPLIDTYMKEAEDLLTCLKQRLK